MIFLKVDLFIFTSQMTKQTCIDELIETFMNRLEYLIGIDDYASAEAKRIQEQEIESKAAALEVTCDYYMMEFM